MEYIRQFLILLRKFNNRKDLKPPFRIVLVIITLVSVLVGTLLDVILPFNFILNGFRAIVAIVSGVSIFSIGYLLAEYISHTKRSKNRFYKTIRKRLSYSQRINISIVIGSVLALLAVISGKPSVIYTLKASLAIAAAITLITFTRKNRDEFLKGAYDIQDVRDIKPKYKYDNKDNEDDEE